MWRLECKSGGIQKLKSANENDIIQRIKET